ncbi:nucleoporin [Culex quinquefasciatus]|uniref:Nucleoporin n=1 Tax=Culex quinquefasciatus TaxID=7176 RepID=B0XCU5_CULQU|nr:nucleoporin [Culex quinquefasciatus]|eukprot:XP_001867467.1 nucleoporin [Culex quinquefasciatus]
MVAHTAKARFNLPKVLGSSLGTVANLVRNEVFFRPTAVTASRTQRILRQELERGGGGGPEDELKKRVIKTKSPALIPQAAVYRRGHTGSAGKGTADEEYAANVKALKLAEATWISEKVKENPVCKLTPIFKITKSIWMRSRPRRKKATRGKASSSTYTGVTPPQQQGQGQTQQSLDQRQDGNDQLRVLGQDQQQDDADGRAAEELFVHDGGREDCKFSIYEDQAVIDSRFRFSPRRRRITGNQLPLLDGQNPVVGGSGGKAGTPKVPPVTGEETPSEFGNDTRSVISSASERKKIEKQNKYVGGEQTENKPPVGVAALPCSVRGELERRPADFVGQFLQPGQHLFTQLNGQRRVEPPPPPPPLLPPPPPPPPP